MDISSMYKLREALKAKSCEIKVQRQRIKACRRMFFVQAHDLNLNIDNAIAFFDYDLAKVLDKQKALCFKRVEGLDKIDFYFSAQQKAIGKIIVEINNYPTYGVHSAREVADLLKLQEKTLVLLIEQSDINFATRHWSF